MFDILTNHDPFIDIYPWDFTLANLRRKGSFVACFGMYLICTGRNVLFHPAALNIRYYRHYDLINCSPQQQHWKI